MYYMFYVVEFVWRSILYRLFIVEINKMLLLGNMLNKDILHL
jgi:hypothetical protein